MIQVNVKQLKMSETLLQKYVLYSIIQMLHKRAHNINKNIRYI